MYTVTVEAGFSAIHQLRLPDGTMEPVHGHDWTVRAHFRRGALDSYGMVIDFHEAQKKLKRTLADLNYVDLNRVDAFAGINPTAEAVARYVFDRLHRTGLTALCRVEVTEAPGCTAGYEPDAPD